MAKYITKWQLNQFDWFAYKFMQFIPPEAAHNLAKWAMKRMMMAPGEYNHCGSRTTLFGCELLNPLGLAAGFDKNGELPDVINKYGFGFSEIGSVTYAGGPGNKKPRMFRVDNNTIMNRMGLNGDPAVTVAMRLRSVQYKNYGINIAKTNDPRLTGDSAIEDMVMCFRALREYGLYHVLNISCPNTQDLTFETPEALRDLIAAINPHRLTGTNLMVKLSPALAFKPVQLNQIIEICESASIAGYIASNTIPGMRFNNYNGGMSGSQCFYLNTNIIPILASTKKLVIACGGISDPVHLLHYHKLGARLFQAYNGFVRGPNAGVRFVERVFEPLATLI